MTANHDLERRLERYYAAEPPSRAPDWVLQSALSTIEDTRQRRGLIALRRYSHLTTFTKLAAAAVVVIAVGGFALWQFGPSSGGPPAPTPSPTAPPPTPSGPSTYVPPALTGAFTSDLHGLSLSYPAGWATRAATEPWTEPDPPQFEDPRGDVLYDPVRNDHLFLVLASQPLGETTFDAWVTDFLTVEGCKRTGDLSVVVEGADRVIGTECNFVFASGGGRVYLMWLYTSADELDLRSFDSGAWLEEILATLQLRPEDAVDAAPTASP